MLHLVGVDIKCKRTALQLSFRMYIIHQNRKVTIWYYINHVLSKNIQHKPNDCGMAISGGKVKTGCAWQASRGITVTGHQQMLTHAISIAKQHAYNLPSSIKVQPSATNGTGLFQASTQQTITIQCPVTTMMTTTATAGQQQLIITICIIQPTEN